MFPAVQWDRQICESVGGTCLPEILEGGYSYPSGGAERQAGAKSGPVFPTSTGCPPPIQRHMEIPFELCPDYELWLENRYIWELSE
jgi:hypothetical protein